MPPFCFLIPLQSKQVSRNWARVTKLFELMLGSIMQQTSENFRVLVACHEIPEVPFADDPRLRFYPVDFAPPASDAPSQVRVTDKYDKLAVLMKELGTIEHSFSMCVDADDLVSRKLVEFAHAHPESNGWIFPHGYRYSMGSRWILEQRGNFVEHCGTSSIIKSSLIEYPKDFSAEQRQKCVRLRAGHHNIADLMIEEGHPLEDLPFPGAIYMTNHGDNDSHLGTKRRWKHWFMRSQWIMMRKYAKQGRWHTLKLSIREEFGMPSRTEMIRMSQV